jgi:hypothetical protein
MSTRRGFRLNDFYSIVDEDDFPQQVEDSDVSMSSTAKGGRKPAAKGKSTTTAKKTTTQKKAAAPARGGKKAVPLVSVKPNSCFFIHCADFPHVTSSSLMMTMTRKRRRRKTLYLERNVAVAELPFRRRLRRRAKRRQPRRLQRKLQRQGLRNKVN